IARQGRGDFETDETVRAARLVVHTAQRIGSGLNVLDDQLIVDFRRGSAEPREPADIIVVLLVLRDGLVKDRGIRGDARHTVLADRLREIAAGQEAPFDIVEPYALAKLTKPAKWIGLSHVY